MKRRWRTVTEVLDQHEVEPLGSVLRPIAARWDELNGALSGGPESTGWARIAEAAKVRREAFAARLR
jgi:hypothetical protein